MGLLSQIEERSNDDKVKDDDVSKVTFAARATVTEFPLRMDEVVLDGETLQALHWTADNTPSEVQQWREAMTQMIEDRSKHLRSSGAVGRWFQGTDEALQGLAATVNGPLLEELV